MTEVQGKLIELLNEIDGFCKKGGLHYFLGGEAALSAYRSGRFESDTAILDIFMTLPEALKLQDMIIAEKNPDRMIESVYNNDRFPNLSFRYCNKNTLYVNLACNAGVKSLGICVKIKILRKFAAGRSADMADFLEHGWDYNYADYPERDKLTEEQKKIKKQAGVLLAVSRKLYRKIMLMCLERTQRNVSLKDELYYESIKNKKHVFGKKLFSRTREVELEGNNYPIPKDVDGYFRVLHSSMWRGKVFTTKEMYDSRIIDPRLPYEVYLSNIKNGDIFSDYRNERDAELFASEDLSESSGFIDQAWKLVLRTGARFNMWQKYMPQKEKIKDLYAQKEWTQLKEIFQEYDAVVRENYKAGLGVCFDREIFEIYLAVLKQQGDGGFANKIKKLIPACHYEPICIQN